MSKAAGLAFEPKSLPATLSNIGAFQARRDPVTRTARKPGSEDFQRILGRTPRYEELVGDLTGAYSRRISLQRRLVNHILERERTVKALRMWTHYA